MSIFPLLDNLYLIFSNSEDFLCYAFLKLDCNESKLQWTSHIHSHWYRSFPSMFYNTMRAALGQSVLVIFLITKTEYLTTKLRQERFISAHSLSTVSWFQGKMARQRGITEAKHCMAKQDRQKVANIEVAASVPSFRLFISIQDTHVLGGATHTHRRSSHRPYSELC